MRTRYSFASLLGILALFLNLTYADSNILRNWLGNEILPSEKPVRATVFHSNPSETEVLFEITGAELISTFDRDGWEVEISGEGHTMRRGVPSLPKVSRLIAIPGRAKVSVEFQVEDRLEFADIELLPTLDLPYYDLSPDVEAEYNSEIYSQNSFFPENQVEVSDPAIMRDIRLVRLTINPLRYNPVLKRLEFCRRFTVKLKYEDGGTVNIKAQEPTSVSRSFARVYNSVILNYPELDLDLDQSNGSTIIIAPNDATVLSITQNLVNWKIQKGYPTTLVTTAQTGTSGTQIRNYLINAYNTYDPPLEYVILIGDCAGTVAVAASESNGDHDYSRLDGDDILADIGVGRFSCANTTQLAAEVNKVVSYESNPYMGQTAWYKRGAVIAGSNLSGLSTIQVNQTVRFKALQNGYMVVDTLWYTMGGSYTTFINNSFNGGISFFNYRGWLGMSGYNPGDPQNLTNYYKIPFVVTITCGTGDITSSGADYTEEFFRAGTPTTPKGGIGAIGTATTGTHTRYNNCVDSGIWGGVFDYGIFEMGYALNVGKYELYMSYPDNTGDVNNFSHWNNLIGDPSCQYITDIPAAITAVCPDTLSLGEDVLNLTLTDSLTQNPLSEALVCLKGTGVYSAIYTDESGELTFPLPELTTGNLTLTVTKHNYRPVIRTIPIVTEPIYVGIDSLDVDDDNVGSSLGNNDGLVNPGETIEMGISLKNFGVELTASNINAVLTSPSEFVLINSSTSSFSNLGPGISSPLNYNYVFTASPDAVYGQILPLNLTINSTQGSWQSYLPITVSAPDAIFLNSAVQSPDARLDPGETAPVVVTLSNIGDVNIVNLVAILYTDNENIDILQDLSSVGTLNAGQSAAGPAFTVQASPYTVPGDLVDFTVFLFGSGDYADTTEFSLTVGLAIAEDPTGPDNYGYYIIDDSDEMYSGRPVYNWVEIDPNSGGAGSDAQLTDFGNEQDDSRLLLLPFTFQYYGQPFDTLTLCSNGWIALGNYAYFTDFRNFYIPSTAGPYSMIAPFWDELYQTTNPVRKVYYYNDIASHRYIIEWNVLTAGTGTPVEKFEVILFDPEFYPASSGDGEIVIQYYDVNNVTATSSWDNSYATVGIKSPDNLDGLLYTYWNDYTPGSATLHDNMALKITTERPVKIIPPTISHPAVENVTSPSLFYNVYADIVSSYPLVQDSLKVFYTDDPITGYESTILFPDTTGSVYQYLGLIPEYAPPDIVYYYLYAADVQNGFSFYPAAGPGSPLSFMVGPLDTALFEDAEMENGWSLGITGDNATSGIWIREDPVISIADNGHIVQPEDDFTTDPGHICFVTGNAALGASGGTNDVDGGVTTLQSPVYDLSAYSNPIISYWYWYTNNQGLNPGQDFWYVAVTEAGSGSWVVIQNTTESTPENWQKNQFFLVDYLTNFTEIQMRFRASDDANGSLVEAAVDDILIVNLDDHWPDALLTAQNIHITVEGDQVTLNWLPDPWAVDYSIVKSDNPYFSFEQGISVGQTASTSISFTSSAAAEFYMIKAQR